MFKEKLVNLEESLKKEKGSILNNKRNNSKIS